MDDHQRDDAEQRQQASRERVQEKRDGRPPPFRPAPDPDQEKERDQGELEKDVEENDVKAREEPEQARFARPAGTRNARRVVL